MIIIKDEMKFKRVSDTIRDSTGVNEGRIQEQTIELDIKEEEIIFKNLNKHNTVFQSFKIPISTQTEINKKIYIDSKTFLGAIKFIRQGDNVQITFLREFAIMFINENEYPILYNKPITLKPPHLEYVESFKMKFYEFQKIMKHLTMKKEQKLKVTIDSQNNNINVEKIESDNTISSIYKNTLTKLNYKTLDNINEKHSLIFNVDNLKKATNLITFAGDNYLNIKISESGPISIYIKNDQYEYICLISPIIEMEQCLDENYMYE